MQISNNVIEKMNSLIFLKENRRTNLPIVLLEDVKRAEKCINSIYWENYFLEKRGDLTAYLFKNEPEIFKEWNKLSQDSRDSIMPIIIKKLNQLVEDKKIYESMIAQIKFDIINLSIYLSIKEKKPQIRFSFFDDIYELYKSGYIPCGYSKKRYTVI